MVTKEFYPLEVAEVIAETDEARSIRFSVPLELESVFRFRAGQHLTLRAEIDGEDVRRNYSLCTAPDDRELKVTVKQIAGGAFSNWVARELKPGDRLDVMPPHGSFTTDFDPVKARRYVAFAGGSGITPIMSLARTALSTEPGSRFTLFYGNRDASSIIFLEQLASLKDRYLGRFELFHFLSDEEGDVDLLNGMLDRATCAEAVASFVPDPEEVDAWFICGPGPMMDSAEAALVER
ncbi:MAG TPA: FAD-binding oxidoreductase, partial [Sphingomicrobium sp.]|nr:FAD-binding oxidoreductase [Sphingomicrobium sp.]